MGNREAEKEAGDAVAGQKEKKKEYIKKGCKCVVTDAVELLSQALVHPVDDGIQIEDQNHGREKENVASGLLVLIEQHTKGLCKASEQAGDGDGKHQAKAETAVSEIVDPLLIPGGTARASSGTMTSERE